jgi:hypothetical protein
MAAPVATARVTPTAKKPADGFKALLTIALFGGLLEQR